MYKKAVETGISVRRVPVGGTWRKSSFTGDFERKVRFLGGGGGGRSSVTVDSERCVKEGSGSRHLSAKSPRWGVSFTGDFEKQV
jgi:hypothetical protein